MRSQSTGTARGSRTPSRTRTRPSRRSNNISSRRPVSSTGSWLSSCSGMSRTQRASPAAPARTPPRGRVPPALACTRGRAAPPTPTHLQISTRVCPRVARRCTPHTARWRERVPITRWPCRDRCRCSPRPRTRLSRHRYHRTRASPVPRLRYAAGECEAAREAATAPTSWIGHSSRFASRPASWSGQSRSGTSCSHQTQKWSVLVTVSKVGRAGGATRTRPAHVRGTQMNRTSFQGPCV